MSNDRLIKEFREDDNTCLMGVHSFWEGVDVKGERLSCVIIDKLPFSVPDTPTNKARCEQIEREGGNWFTDYAIPQAQIRLKQGFGRLIRTKTDRGVVAILDVRIHKKFYGKEFLQVPAPLPGDETHLRRCASSWGRVTWTISLCPKTSRKVFSFPGMWDRHHVALSRPGRRRIEARVRRKPPFDTPFDFAQDYSGLTELPARPNSLELATPTPVQNRKPRLPLGERQGLAPYPISSWPNTTDGYPATTVLQLSRARKSVVRFFWGCAQEAQPPSFSVTLR